MLKKSLTLLILLTSLLAQAETPAYDEAANAREDVKQALIEARKTQKSVLLVFGANWCKDCRALDSALKSAKNAALIGKEFKVVKIDVGRFNKHLDIDAVYGNPIKQGIPAVVVLAPDQRVLYATRAGELANAREMSEDGVYAFFHDIVQKAASQAG